MSQRGQLLNEIRAKIKEKGFTTFARESGLGREHLYKLVAKNGNPTLDTFVKLVKALGCKVVLADDKDKK